MLQKAKKVSSPKKLKFGYHLLTLMPLQPSITNPRSLEQNTVRKKTVYSAASGNIDTGEEKKKINPFSNNKKS